MKRRFWLGTFAAIALVVGAGSGWYLHHNSPRQVAIRYIQATAGDLGGLKGSTLAGDGSSVQEIIRATRGEARKPPVVITSTREEPAFYSVRYVIVTGTSGGVPFSAGVSLYKEHRNWKVGSEWKP